MIIEITKWAWESNKPILLFQKKVKVKSLGTGSYGVYLRFHNGRTVILKNEDFTVNIWEYDNESTK